MCAQNHQKKAAVVGTLVRKFRSIFISKSSLHIARASSRRCIAQRSNCADRAASFRWKQRQFRRKTGWVLWRTHSKNRAEIRKNEFSFLRNRRYFSCVFRYNSSLKKRGLPHQNRRIIYDFSSKKAAAYCARERPQMRCSAAGLRSQRSPNNWSILLNLHNGIICVSRNTFSGVLRYSDVS